MRQQQHSSSAVRRAVLNTLENRRLCSVTAFLDGGNLMVAGDGEADAIVIRHSGLTTTVNGQAFSDFAITQGIKVYPNGTPAGLLTVETVAVQSSAKPVEIFADTTAGRGLNALDVTVGANGKTGGVQQVVTLHGNASTRLTVDNGNAWGGASVALGYAANGKVSTITGASPAPVRFDGAAFEAVNVRLGQGNDAVTVKATSPALNASHNVVPVTIDAGKGTNWIDVLAKDVNAALRIDNTRGGHDAVRLGAGNLNKIVGDVLVANTTGLSTLSLDDVTDNTTGKQFTLATGRIEFGNDGATPGLRVTFDPAKLDALNATGGRGYANFRVLDTLHPSAGANPALTSVRSGQRSSTFAVLGTTGPLQVDVQTGQNSLIFGNGLTSAIKGDVEVNDPWSGDTLRIDAGKTTAAMSVLLNAGTAKDERNQTISGACPGRIRFGATTRVSITTGSGNDVVKLSGSSIRGRTELHTGAGDDYVWVGNANAALDDLRSNVDLDGGAGRDVLYFLDTGATGPQSYLDGVNFFQRLGTPAVVYAGFEGHAILR